MKTKLFIMFLIFSFPLFAQFGSQDSGGKLIDEQACFDVKFYDIAITISPEDKAIAGNAAISLTAVKDFQKIMIDLDEPYNIQDLEWLASGKTVNYTHEKGKIWITFPETIKSGTQVKLRIEYSGIPRVAQRPPWDDGFIWKKAKDGSDWASVSCQGGGADIWWPCKDHPSDEPDSVALHFTVPEKLDCISNGRFVSAVQNNDETKTYNWFVSTPINNYNVTFYLGPYREIDYDYTSVTGEKFPFIVWALPENYEKAKLHAPQFLQQMKVNEEILGPYPFRGDKYGVVEAPHLGMEHQSAIAYGYGWKNHESFEFDWLHQHEFSHEWWGNLVTAKDWSDFWIHEGTGTYMQPLYLEKVFGKNEYFKYMQSIKRFSNKTPVAPRGELTSGQSYNLDIYYKGAWVLHTLRYYLGDSTFFKVLRRWAYPTVEMEKIKDGRQCRLATTDEFLDIAEKVSGKKLGWFWEVYLRHKSLPVLKSKVENGNLLLNWETEDNLPFELPVEIKTGERITRVNMEKGSGEVIINSGDEITIDPEDWILREN